MIWLRRTTDNSTYFAQSLEIRGIESRLYIQKIQRALKRISIDSDQTESDLNHDLNQYLLLFNSDCSSRSISFLGPNCLPKVNLFKSLSMIWVSTRENLS